MLNLYSIMFLPAIFHLLGTIKLLPCGLTSFDVSKTGLSTRCLNRIGEVLLQAPNILAGLATLKINDNGLRGEDFPVSLCVLFL